MKNEADRDPEAHQGRETEDQTSRRPRVPVREPRHENLFINLRANPPEVTELCTCEWDDDE
jgi:hypothetical protein